MIEDHHKSKTELSKELVALCQKISPLPAVLSSKGIRLAEALIHAQKHSQRLDQLNHLALLLSQAPNSESAFKAVAQHLADIVGSDRSSLALVNDARTHLEIFVMDGERGKIPTGTRLPLAETMMGQVVQSQKIKRSHDIRQEHYIDAQRIAEIGILSAMNAPLHVGDQIIGLLNVGLKQVNAYTLQHERLMIQISSLLATTLENQTLLCKMQERIEETKRAEAALEAQAQRLNKLNALILGLSQARTSKEAFQVLATHTKQITNTERVSVSLLNEAGMLELFALDGTAGALPTGVTLPLKGTMIGAVVEQQKPILVLDTSHSQWADVQQLEQMGLRATLDVPLITAGKVIGTLNTASQTADVYRADTEPLLLQIASMFATTIENKQLFEQTIEAKEAAEIANRAKSDFLSNMSHELRTPLNGILGYAQLFQRDRSLSPSQKNKIGIIHKSGHHLLTLINDILDLSKIEAGKMDLYPQDLHLCTFLNPVVGIIRMRAEEKNLRLLYEPDERLPVGVQADEKRLRQVLINLLGNAVKFTERGQVTLKVSRQDNQSQNQATLRFEIIDTGVGMTAKELEKVFLSFEQVGDLKQRAQGTGLGLAITRKLVNLMGSKVQVESELGKGSRFWVDLQFPVVMSNEPIEYSVNRYITGYQGTTQTILVVDDQVENRYLLRDLLMPLGFAIIEAENGLQEVEIARQIKPDLILTDLMMPVMNGFEAMKKIRQFAPDMPIIAISANAFEASQQKSRLAGCDAFLSKPIDEETLLALIKQYLELEWIYEHIEEQEHQGVAEESTEDSKTDASLIAPPAEELEKLGDLATLGKISDIRKWAAHIEQLDVNYAPFANQVRHLARGFEDDKIVALVEEYLNQQGK